MSRRRGLMGVEKQPVFVDWIQNTGGGEYIMLPGVKIDNAQLRVTITIQYVSKSSANFVYLAGAGYDFSDRSFSVNRWKNDIEARLSSGGTKALSNPANVFGGNPVRISFGKTNSNAGVNIWVYNEITQVGVGGEQIPYTQFTTPPVDFAIFGANLLLQDSVQISSDIFKVKNIVFRNYSSSEPIDQIVPCFYEGQYGLWSLTKKEFYGNSGTGTITGGYD